MNDTIELRNHSTCASLPNLYYPRLQINKHGEIVLSLYRNESDTLTVGILVGKTKDSKSTVEIGKRFDDWEVCGKLEDYDGEVTLTIKNAAKRKDVR